MNNARVLVGISGGVDSSVAALLLTQRGYDVHGVFIKSWEDTYDAGYCMAAEDLCDAEDVCATLEIPLHKVSFAADYQQRVFKHFLEEYRQGRTPNPDILCNKEIKFGTFMRYAERFGSDMIATGHYAQRDRVDGRERLRKGQDSTKDQSYFLHTLDQAQLARALFPIGELSKQRVRELAASAGLNTYDKKDSTGICFIGERRFREFLGRYLPTQPGMIRTVEGNPVGEHCGLAFYTLGQRQGLGIGGRQGGSGDAWYVVDKDLQDNVLTVAQGGSHPRLFHSHLRASQLHWIDGKPPVSTNIQAKIRFRQEDQPCTIETLVEATCTVRFAQPQRAITPGQAVVFYRDDECLGGGIIDNSFD